MQAKRLLLAAALALGAVSISAVAEASTTASSDAASDAVAAGADLHLAQETGVLLPDEVITALERDLDLSQSELEARLANESGAAETVEQLEADLGPSFAGAWLEGDTAELTVAITDPAKAAEVRAAGGQPELVAHSQDALDAAVAELDRHGDAAPDGVTGWYVDVEANSAVVTAMPGVRPAAQQFVADSGADADAVRVEMTREEPRLFTHLNIRGGDAFFTSNARCSIGFSVVGGYTTVGHCGNSGASTWGFNQVSQGTFQNSVFPGADAAWVANNGNWTPRPWVNNWQGGNVLVLGSQEAPIGASICRSGSTTGWHCGNVQAKNVTVQYPQGTVFGLTQTSVCAEPGDSGGSYISGNQAQGMTSGGSGNCTFGGTTFYQPVNPLLNAWGLTLVTG